MIKIVLDQHRRDPTPIVLVADLPCQQPERCHIEAELSLHDERPVVDLRLKSGDNEPRDFFLALVNQDQFFAWRDVTNAFVSPPAAQLALQGTRFATSASGQLVEVTLHRSSYPLAVRIWVYPQRQITVTDFPTWGEDLGTMLDLAIAIDEYVEQARSEQRETLLSHIDALLMQRFL